MQFAPPALSRRTAGMSDTGAAADPDGVLAAAPRSTVEPAVDGVDDPALVAQQLLPLRDREPRERHLRLGLRAAHAEDQRARLLVPLGPLPDTRLAFEPPAVRVGDVVRARCEDVEDQATLRR